MISLKLILSLSLLLVFNLGYAQQWQQLSDFPGTARDDGASFVIGDKAYCGTGVVSWFATQRDFYAFNMLTESWATISSLPPNEQRQYANAFSWDSLGFLVAGYNGSDFLNDLWIYDPIQDQWNPGTDLPAQGRSGAASFVIDGIAYLIGGKTADSSSINEVWAYDISADSWQRKADFPFGGRWRSSASVIGNEGYLIFGLDENGRYCNELYKYDPDIDSWSKLSEFPESGRTYSSLEAINGNLIVFAGMDSLNHFYNDMWLYDMGSGNWSTLDSIQGAGRRGGMCFNDGESIYYTTGLTEDHSRLKESWKNSNLSSIDEIGLKPGLLLYPNPTEDWLTLQIQSSGSTESHVLIFDSNGKLVRMYKFDDRLHRINLKELSTGIYYLLLQHDDVALHKKIVKY